MNSVLALTAAALLAIGAALVALAWWIRNRVRDLQERSAEITGWIRNLDERTAASESLPRRETREIREIHEILQVREKREEAPVRKRPGQITSDADSGVEPGRKEGPPPTHVISSEDLYITDPYQPYFGLTLEEVFEGLDRRYVRRDLTVRSLKRDETLQGDPQGALHLLTTVWNFSKPFSRLVGQLRGHGADDHRIVVHVADFCSDDASIEDILEKSNIPYCLYEHSPPFAKAQGMETLVSSPWIPDDAIIVCVDADMQFPAETYRRIRRTVRVGQQFYAPQVGCLNEAGEIYGVGEETGGHGFLAVSVSDARSIGDYAAGIYRYKRTWGGEETDFADRLEASGLKKVRDIDPRITAGYHRRSEDDDWYRTCSTRDFHETQASQEFEQEDKSENLARDSADAHPAVDSEGPILTPILTHGLGNKLFQIAAALGLARANDGRARFVTNAVTETNYAANKTAITADWRDFRDFAGHQMVELAGLPRTLPELFPRLEFSSEPAEPRLLRRRASNYIFEPYRVNQDGYYYETLDFGPLSGSVTLEGYFFSHRHFLRHIQEVREQLQPAACVTQYIDETFGELLERRPVAMHLRFGGLAGDHYTPLAPSADWYREALDTVPSDGPVLVCADKIDIAREFLADCQPGREFVFSENQPGYVDLFLMSRCAHIVFSISTLAAWGAILNPSDDQVVVCHPHYRVKYGMTSTLPSWVTIDDKTEPFQKETYPKTRGHFEPATDDGGQASP